jgi:hypothetical protein
MGHFQIINFHVVVTPTHYDPINPAAKILSQCHTSSDYYHG